MADMSRAGWYPDPGGAPGMFRYWDGTSWASTVSSQPFGPPQPDAGGGQPLTSRPQPTYASASYQQPGKPTSGLKQLAWGVLVLAVVGALVFGGLQLLRSIGLSPFEPNTPSNPSTNPCPPEKLTPPTIPPPANDGRVHGGKLSYPMLGSPWGAPKDDQRLPFGRDVSVQDVMVEQNFDGLGSSWVASVLVGELIAGDGFFSPKEGADLIAKCAMARFYSDALVQRNDQVSKAITISGKEGWVIETHLTFDIKGLQTKGETAIFLVMPTSATSSSIYYASIPDTTPQYLSVARDVMAQLQVDP